MRRQLILLSVLVVGGVAVGGYKYIQWREETEHAAKLAEIARATEAAAKKREQALRDQGKLVSQAREWLDAYPAGGSEGLAQARENLEKVLKASPNNAQARIQMARFHIKAGYINSRNFTPGSLDRANWELKRALAADPKSADAYVLQGHLFFLLYRPVDALKSLEKAKAIGTDNPFLYLNWVDALMDLKRWNEAEEQLRNLLARYGEGVRGSVHAKLAGIYRSQGKLDEADKQYREFLALEPRDAWGHGNYAYFLLFTRGMPDAAITEAEKALEIMNYGIGRLTLAAALYAKWAQEKHRAPKRAAEYLARAKAEASDYSWIMSQAARSVSAGPAIQNMVKELVALGVPLDTKDNYGDTGLTLAADAGDLRSVILLIKYGANIEAANNPGQTVVAQAAIQGHVDVVKALAARGADVNSRDFEGRTALYFAAQNGNKEMVSTLISLKAKVDIGMKSGYTPLMAAAFRGDEDMVRLLLQLGADPSLATKDTQQTAADFAKSLKHEALATLIREAAEKSSR
jgi:Tfp pilus assembly protein PilF